MNFIDERLDGFEPLPKLFVIAVTNTKQAGTAKFNQLFAFLLLKLVDGENSPSGFTAERRGV